MTVTQTQARCAPDSERCTPLRLVPREAADYDAQIAASGLDESQLALLRVIRDAGMGLVEQFRAVSDRDGRAELRNLAFKACKDLIVSDDRRDVSRGIQFCLALLHEQNHRQKLEIDLAIAGMGMIAKVVGATASSPNR